MKKYLGILLLLLGALITFCDEDDDAVSDPWPMWIFDHWVWLDESTTESVQEMVLAYEDHDIPVGAVIIDSPWETGYNTFEWDTSLYPDPQALVDWLHERDIRVIVWIVSTINTDSPNFDLAKNAGYLVGDGAITTWWKGDGAFLDYTNPEALEYWHGLMDKVLDLGIDGWKCDGTDFNYVSLSDKTTYQELNGGDPVDLAEYRELYYGDFYSYTRERLGNDRMITARPVDAYNLAGVPMDYITFSNPEINYAGWVGDQDPTFDGLQVAMENIMLSAKMGFVGAGSDIAAYRGDNLRDKDLFIRWAQFGAICPIMENGGNGPHFPWEYDDETVEIYRDFVELHYDLIPYFNEQYHKYYHQGLSIFQPPYGIWEYTSDTNILSDIDYSFKLGDDLFIATMYESGTSRDILFPSGNTWVDYWNGTEYEGGTSTTYDCPLDRYPIFIRKGASLP